MSGTTRKLILAFTCLAICLVFVPSAKGLSPVSLTCPAIPPGSFSFNDTTKDVTISCALVAGSVDIKAHSIFVDGAAGGKITTTGTGGIKLSAFMNTSSNPACLLPLAQQASATITLHGTDLEDENSNGGILLKSCGSILSDLSTTVHSNGDVDEFHCYLIGSPAGSGACAVTVDNNTFFGNRILLLSQGDLTMVNSTFTTIGPRDQQSYVSFYGSVLAGQGCDQTAPLACGTTLAQACQLCQECHGKNRFSGGHESNFLAFGLAFVDLDGACIDIAENITIVADETDSNGAANNKLADPVGGGVNVSATEARNDFAKTGKIMVSSHPNWTGPGTLHPRRPGSGGLNGSEIGFSSLPGDGVINIDNAIIVDDGANGGGPDPTKVANMNGGQDFLAGNCAVVPTCNNRPIPLRGFVADSISRTAHNVLGLPRCDS